MGCLELWGKFVLEISENHPDSILITNIEFQITIKTVGFIKNQRVIYQKVAIYGLRFFFCP